MAFVPTPDQFPTWQEWARHVVEVLSDSGGSGASPTVSQSPPLQKILRAQSGGYALSGVEALFMKGPFFYKLQALAASFELAGQDSDLFKGQHAPFVAAKGTFTLTGQVANLNLVTGGLPTQGRAVPTFHSIGLYWVPVNASGARVTPTGNAVKIRYRRLGEANWHNGHDMWYDGRAVGGRPQEARGSIFFCLPNTDYIVQFGLPGGSTTWIAQLQTRTWTENPPIGTTVPGWTGVRTATVSGTYGGNGSRSGLTFSANLLMDRSGTPNAYTLYDFTGMNATAQGGSGGGQHCVAIKGSYMILRGLKCRGGGDHSIFICHGSHDIFIEDCDIAGFGRASGATFTIQYKGTSTTSDGTSYSEGVNEDSGISLQAHPNNYGTQQNFRIIIQRCKIHNPRFGNRPWEHGHPAGITAIMCYPNGGNHVIRYNEFYSVVGGDGASDPGYGGTPLWQNFYNDCLMGGDNFSYGGSPGADTDIYKNIMMHSMDDLMEMEGGGMNVRVWKNYGDYCATGFASTVCSLGPLYFIRNIVNRVRNRYDAPWGSEAERLGMFKAGSPTPNGGRRYCYHNTALQMSNPNGGRTLGCGYGISDTSPSNGIMNTVTRNNIWDMWSTASSPADPRGGSGNDPDYDMTASGSMGWNESHGLTNTRAVYQTGNGPTSTPWNGRYRLAPGSAGHGTGAIINGINNEVDAPHQFLGTGPDRGAHEDGTTDMLFGIAAANSGP